MTRFRDFAAQLRKGYMHNCAIAQEVCDVFGVASALVTTQRRIPTLRLAVQLQCN